MENKREKRKRPGRKGYLKDNPKNIKIVLDKKICIKRAVTKKLIRKIIIT